MRHASPLLLIVLCAAFAQIAPAQQAPAKKDASACDTLSHFARRWMIEVTFREIKTGANMLSPI